MCWWNLMMQLDKIFCVLINCVVLLTRNVNSSRRMNGVCLAFHTYYIQGWITPCIPYCLNACLVYFHQMEVVKTLFFLTKSIRGITQGLVTQNVKNQNVSSGSSNAKCLKTYIFKWQHKFLQILKVLIHGLYMIGSFCLFLMMFSPKPN